jgi:hypothetical protein
MKLSMDSAFIHEDEASDVATPLPVLEPASRADSVALA